MIVIDMDMPECWDDCRFNNGCECCLIDAVCTDETAEENGELPSFCPISRYKGHWIEVKDRLPTKEECIESNCLFIVSDGNRTYAEYFDRYENQYFGEPTMEGFRVDRCVSAWMPLPKPYKPQKSEKK